MIQHQLPNFGIADPHAGLRIQAFGRCIEHGYDYAQLPRPMTHHAYEAQNRGKDDAYARYLRAMDASMRQKVALTAAHLLGEGKVADMGMGSGSGSFALAALYPGLQVIGVDVNPEMVRRAQEQHRLDNLQFIEGDIAAPCFSAQSMEAIINSSVLHHVTTFNGYDRHAAARALAVQVDQLCTGGVLLLRDFIDPGEGRVCLDLPANDFSGDSDSDDPQRCSTAALFRRFGREFRILRDDPDQRGFSFEQRRAKSAWPLTDGWQRFALRHRHAVEFILRKDYRSSWSVEVQEEYTYATQAELEATYEQLGLRVLASTPIYNPWIIRHRFRDKFQLWTEGGEALDYPPTNYVIVGQKVAPGEGVRIVEEERIEPTGYLALSHYRHRHSKKVFDLARRPGPTIDVLPWFIDQGQIYVLARRSYPRPVVRAAAAASVPIDGATASTYLTEPLNMPERDAPIEDSVLALLAEFPDLGATTTHAISEGEHYYPSPGGIQEQVRSVLVEVDAVRTQTPIHPVSGFSTSGVLRGIEACQLLRAAQVGGLPEARLELNTYELLLRRKRDPGDWIGASLTLEDGDAPTNVSNMTALSARDARRAFEPASAHESSGFLELRCSMFVEYDAKGQAVAQQSRELVIPRTLSVNTIATALLKKSGGTIYLGIAEEDLPAAQCFTNNSRLLVTPAWRLPHEVHGRTASRRWIARQIESYYGYRCRQLWDLGGRYHPSPGLTPERVYPLAVEVDTFTGAGASLFWVPLRDVVSHRNALRDGHLRIVALRAAHALGQLPTQTTR